MKLYCFDVDGTLLTDEMENEGQYVKGIIPTKKLIELEKKGNKIAIVSPSPFLPARYTDDNHWFKKFGSNEYRGINVEMAMNAHGISAENTIYVDDLKSNRNQLEKINVESYSPEKFMKFISKGYNTNHAKTKREMS